jgi:hypothetical protein
MNKTIRRTGVATACLATVLGGAAALTGPADAAHGTTLRFVAHDVPGQMAFDDLGAASPNGPEIGDVLAFTQRLTRAGHTVGRVSNAAVGVDQTRHLFQANGTIVVAHGSVEYGGLVSQGSRFVLAVTGGTGRYVGATGSVTFTFKGGRQLLTVALRR